MDLAERIAAFFPAAWRRRVIACGGIVHEIDGLAVCLTGVPAKEFNPTLVERAPRDLDGAIAAAEACYRDVAFGIDLDAALHDEVRAAAQRSGLAMVESRPAMAVSTRDLPEFATPAGVTLARITDAASLDEVARVDSAAFDGDAAIIRRFLPDEVLEDPAQRVYCAWADGAPVAVGESAVVDGVLGVFGVATLPAYRRRGIGAALTAFQVNDRRTDADLAVLQASELGSGVYERLGFRTVSTWEVWVRPD